MDDPLFYKFYNIAMATNVPEKLESIMIIIFCYHMMAVVGQ